MMSKKFLIISIIIFLLFGFSKIYAEPVVNSVSGMLNHKERIIINGSGFRTKSPAAPLVWDDCEDKTVDNPDAIFSEGGYSDAWQLQDDYWKTQYRSASFRNVNGPHRYSQKYIAGGHQDSPDHKGRNVHVTAYAGVEKPRWFAMWYMRYDPLWPSCGSDCPNNKITDLTTTSEIYTGDNNIYLDVHQYGDIGGRECSNNPRMCIQSQGGYCGYNTGKYDGLTVKNPKFGWTHYEQRVAMDDLGFLQLLSDNELGYDLKNCPNFRSNIKSFSIGGFYRYNGCSGDYHTHDDAFRYFDDIYIDTTLSRVMLANDSNYDNATIIEPQIPSAWDEGSITCTVNLGRLPANGVAYLFVFDADNNHNSEGYPVNINYSEGGIGTAQLDAPTGLEIVDIEN